MRIEFFVDDYSRELKRVNWPTIPRIGETVTLELSDYQVTDVQYESVAETDEPMITVVLRP